MNKINFSNFMKRFSNTGSVVGFVGLVGLLLIQFGLDVDMVWLENTIKIVCAMLVYLGFLNNPETDGIDLPMNPFNKNEKEK